ncbi:hypothetical protein F5148DRAFT_1214216 [Russula earlei]|uniref:Uncharacterized protein n=1 Tax=Russula earlei TaxID=71964 RepID=A0ACC0U3T2_9AGAM|nr:hypothetical protein F5148DRAFT_1214216 [Russula earlei]
MRRRPCMPSPCQLEMTTTPWPRHDGKSNTQVGLAAHHHFLHCRRCIALSFQAHCRRNSSSSLAASLETHRHGCSHNNNFSTSNNVWPHSNVRRPGRMHLHARTIHCPVNTHTAHPSHDGPNRHYLLFLHNGGSPGATVTNNTMLECTCMHAAFPASLTLAPPTPPTSPSPRLAAARHESRNPIQVARTRFGSVRRP